MSAMNVIVKNITDHILGTVIYDMVILLQINKTALKKVRT